VSTMQLRVATAVAAVLAGLVASAVTTGTATATPSVKTVNCDNGGSLQSAINAVAVGGTVKVSGVCNGNFSITKNVTVAGAPAATLDGGGTGTVLTIAPNLKVVLSHVAVQDGFSQTGSGMFVGADTHLSLSHVTVSHNLAFSDGAGIAADDNTVLTANHSTFSFNNSALSNNTPVDLTGAAISSAGSVSLNHSSITNNSLSAMSVDSIALGGAVYVLMNLTVTDSTFAHNVARGTGAQGGSIYAAGTSTTIVNSTFTDDAATGADPADSQSAGGGSIMSVGTTNSIRGVRIAGSRAEVTGPQGGLATGGGADFAKSATITDSTFSDDAATAAATGMNSEVIAQGGGLMLESNATTTISRTTLDDNVVTAKSTQGDAYAEGGGLLALGELTVSSSTISHNKVAASSGTLALGSGGGIMVSSQTQPTTITNSTVADNSSAATRSNGVGPAVGSGGGVQDESTAMRLRYDTVVGNSTRGSSSSQGGGLDLTTGLALPKPTTLATIWSGNQAQTGPQCDGGFTSAGWNLFAGLSGCATTTTSSDRTHGSARLGSLASNGGPTKTIALKAGSAALDRIPRSACRAVVKTDQRGQSRPQAAAKKASHRRCDIGAYERVVHH
jgi:hypothetical protein